MLMSVYKSWIVILLTAIILSISVKAYCGIDFSGGGYKYNFDNLGRGVDVYGYVRYLQGSGLYDLMDDGTYERLKEKAAQFNMTVPKRGNTKSNGSVFYAGSRVLCLN